MILNENVSINDINSAIDGHQCVIMNYKGDDDTHKGARMIEVYAYGLTSAGNPVIRAFEKYGDTKTKVPAWKYFRLDRIASWSPTEQTFSRPANEYYPGLPSFNKTDDRLMSVVYKIAKFDNETTDVPQSGPKIKDDVYQTDAEKEIAKRGERLRQQLDNPVKIDDFKTKDAFSDVKTPAPTSGPKLKSDSETTKATKEEPFKTDTERRMERLRKQLEHPITLDDYLKRSKQSDVDDKEEKPTADVTDTAPTKAEPKPQEDIADDTFKTDTERRMERLRQQMQNPRKIDLSRIPKR